MIDKYKIIFLLVLLNVGMTAFFLTLLPEQIPIHYNFTSEVDRMGSKFELFTLTALVALSGLVFCALSGYYGKKGRSNNAKALIRVGIALMVLLSVTEVAIFVYSLSYDPTAPSQDTENFVSKVMVVGTGCIFMLLGNVMPKLTRNGVIGIRNDWTRNSEVVWQKTHRFGGYVFVVMGLILAVLGAILDSSMSVGILFIVMIAGLGLCLYMSWVYHKQELEPE